MRGEAFIQAHLVILSAAKDLAVLDAMRSFAALRMTGLVGMSEQQSEGPP
jgi:hypothetical protein